MFKVNQIKRRFISNVLKEMVQEYTLQGTQIGQIRNGNLIVNFFVFYPLRQYNFQPIYYILDTNVRHHIKNPPKGGKPQKFCEQNPIWFIIAII